MPSLQVIRSSLQCSNLIYPRTKYIFKTFNINLSRLLSTAEIRRNNDSNTLEPYIPKSSKEVLDILDQIPDSPPNSKLLKIAIIGIPNSGKSTLINQLVKWKVCSVSKKVHTTTCNARALTNEGNSQLIFLDTPGIVTAEEIKQHKLRNTLISDPEASLEQADCIGVLHDVSNQNTRHHLHPGVLRLLSLYPTIPSILILNKVDLLYKKTLLLPLVQKLTAGKVNKLDIPVQENTSRFMSNKDLAKQLLTESDQKIPKNEIEPSYNVLPNSEENIDIYKNDPVNLDFTMNDVLDGKIKLTESQISHFIKDLKYWPKFNEVFIVSALNGEGVEDLRNFFVKSGVSSPWMFSDDVLTDQAPQDVALLTVREKCLDHLPRNIPYEFTFKLIYWDLSEADVLNVLISIHSKKPNLYKYLLGASGSKLKLIAQDAEQEMRNIFRTEVRLRINVDSKAPPKTKKKFK